MGRRPTRWLAAVAFLLVVALVAFVTADGIDVPGRAAVGHAVDPCRSPLPDRAVGIAPGSEWKRDPRAVKDMGVMADIGVRWVRLGFEWAVIEPRPGQFRWGTIDKIMKGASSHCLAVLAMVGTTPQWARRRGCPTLWCPPADPADFAAFLGKVADRYPGRAIDAWEIWNEPNFASWFRPRPGPALSGRLLVTAAHAIRAHEPGATVLSGGLAPSPVDDARRQKPDRFLDELYATGAMDVVDAVGYHPYSYPDLPSVKTGDNGFVDQGARVRDVMVRHGDADKRVWLTEFGYPTPGGGSPILARQEQTVTSAFETWRSLDWAGPLFCFAWRDPEAGSSNLQRNFGLRRHDDSPKPAYAVFVEELQR